jgi:hypothetical protein
MLTATRCCPRLDGSDAWRTRTTRWCPLWVKYLDVRAFFLVIGVEVESAHVESAHAESAQRIAFSHKSP